jgi:hypothetical protein
LEPGFYLPENPDYTIQESARDSVRFAHFCLEPAAQGRWRARSSFVDPCGEIMHWHDFGDLEGPGWAANAVGGAYQLYAWGAHDQSPVLQSVALGLLDHVLLDGFVREDGFVTGYRDTARNALCLNYKHNDDWFCPGAMARIGLQMLWAADQLDETDARAARLRSAAQGVHEWLGQRVAPIDGWYPRRCAPDGSPYSASPEGAVDPFFLGSADGLYIPWLGLALRQRGMEASEEAVRAALDTFVRRGGIYGSINHDTYDADENVARAEAFRLLLAASHWFEQAEYRTFAYEDALAGLERFKMREDRNGVATRGLLFMEDSWDTAYMWENAEAALAYLDAYEETVEERYLCHALTILRAIAKHHYGPHGFLTEGVDWNNHVGAEHHIDGAEFGAIRYTEPLLNNLHHTEAVLRVLSIRGTADAVPCL